MVDTTNFNVVPNNEEEEFTVDFGEVINVGGGGGTSDFNALKNRPKYDNQTMTGSTNIPKVPTKTSDLNNDSNYQTGTEVASSISSAIGQIDIPAKTSDLTNDGSDGTSTYVEADELAKVATTGDYDDLTDKPTIPTVNDATLTITQNGTSKGTFTANDADDTTIEVSDTTYSDFVGTDGNTGGTAGLVPAPATTDAGKFLKADGTWDTAGGGPTVVQTTGTSTTDVMSQDATTKLIYPDIVNSPYKMMIGEGSIAGTNKALAINGIINAGINGGSIAIGATDGSQAQIGLNGRADRSVAIGNGAIVGRGWSSVAIGHIATANSGQDTGDNVALGYNSYAGGGSATSTVALGAYAQATRTGEVNIGTGSNGTGYNSTNYRVLGGVHDPLDAHDATTKGYVDSIVVNYATLTAAGVPTTSTAAVSVGQLYYDSTNDDYYYCSAIDTTDPNNPSYTWSALSTGGGGGPTVVQTTGTSTTDVMSQNATTSMVFSDPSTTRNVSIGNTNAGSSAVSIGRSAYGAGEYSTAIGYQSNTYNGSGAVAVGQGARARNTNAVAIGYTANQGLDGGANSVAIGSNAKANTSGSVSIGYNTVVQGADNIALGSGAQTSGSVINTAALGASSLASHRGSVALGSSAQTTSKGQIMVGTTNTYDGYNSTNYRLVSGVHDGQSAQDAVTVNQVNATIDAINTALSTNIPHIGA